MYTHGRAYALPNEMCIRDSYEPDGLREAQLERFDFYERGRKAYACVATGETALYANIILKKGVVKL